MIRFFADAFYWIALINPRDAEHARVSSFARTFPEIAIVTTDEVLTEVLTFFSGSARLRADATRSVRALLAGETRVIEQSHASFLNGLALYEGPKTKAIA